jgi:hypothetical protein
MWPKLSYVRRAPPAGGRQCRPAPEVLAEGGQHILVRFEADSPHHQHAVTKQALDSLLMQLLEEVAAVGSNRVHA